MSDWVLGNKSTAKTMSSCLGAIIKSVFLCVYPLSGRRSFSHCNMKTIPSLTQLELATGTVNAPARCSAAPLPVQVSPSAISQSPWCDATSVINTALPRPAPWVWDLFSVPTALIANTSSLYSYPSPPLRGKRWEQWTCCRCKHPLPRCRDMKNRAKIEVRIRGLLWRIMCSVKMAECHPLSMWMWQLNAWSRCPNDTVTGSSDTNTSQNVMRMYPYHHQSPGQDALHFIN